VIALLLAKAGLRAGEIANLTWEMVLCADGQISLTVELRDWAAKKSGGRLIPFTSICARLWSFLNQSDGRENTLALLETCREGERTVKATCYKTAIS
jgi:integrase